MSTTTGAGRPRLTDRKRPGETAREEILDATAELFTTRGYTNTSTRTIADAVGMRQASLYHHFAGKDALLDALLSGTVDEPLTVGREISESDASAAEKVYALAWFDANQLSRSRWNLGALYLLPELREERFETFRQHRYALMDLYASLASAMLVELGVDAMAGTEDVPFRLVETVVNGRADAENGRVTSVESTPEIIADAAVRVLGWAGPTADLRAGAVRILGGAAYWET